MLIALSISIFILKIIWFWIQQLVVVFLKLILPSNLENNVKFSFDNYGLQEAFCIYRGIL